MSLYDNFYFRDCPLDPKLFADLGELTLEDIQKAEYQTKDLGQTFNGHFFLEQRDPPIISKDYSGAPFPDQKIWVLVHHEESFEWEEGDPKGKSILDRLGYTRVTGTKDILSDIGTTTISVYNFFESKNYDYWVEFDLVFIYGRLDCVNLKEWKETSNVERLKGLERLRQKIQAHQDYQKTFIGKIRGTLEDIHRKIILKPQVKIGDFLIRTAYKIRNWRI